MQETRFDPCVRKIPWRGNGNPLQYSCLENSMNRGVCRPQSTGLQGVRHNWATNTLYVLVSFWSLKKRGAKFGSNCLKVTAKSMRYIDLGWEVEYEQSSPTYQTDTPGFTGKLRCGLQKNKGDEQCSVQLKGESRVTQQLVLLAFCATLNPISFSTRGANCISCCFSGAKLYPTHCDPMRCMQHARLPCPSWSPRLCSNSCPLSQGCHPTISSSATTFPSCLQSFPASESFPVSQLFTSGGQSIGASASASVLPVNIRWFHGKGWFPLGLTGLISLLSKGLSRVFTNTTLQKHQFFGTQPSLWSISHIHTWLPEKL